jgi:hypothetical protein
MLDAEMGTRKLHDEELHDCALYNEGKMWQAWGRREMMKWLWGLKPKKRDCKKDVGVDEMILLKGTLKKADGGMRSEFRPESIGELLRTR